MGHRGEEQREESKVNKSDSERYVHIYYDYPFDKKFAAFSKYLEK